MTRLLLGNCLDVLPTLDAGSVRCCVSSPPYFGLRDYGHADQIGQEKTPDEYVSRLVEVFREVRRVLADDGTLWLNIGDSYTGARGGAQGATGSIAQRSHAKSGCRVRRVSRVVGGLARKNLIGIPWRVAFALQADGWFLRSDIIWAKPCPLPESVEDRPTKAHEYLFLLSKSERYFYDAAAIRERAVGNAPGNKTHRGATAHATGDEHHRTKAGLTKMVAAEWRNARTVWTIPSEPFVGAHFAVMPSALVVPCILAGSAIGDEVLDPFGGSGTVGAVATELGRRATLIELNPAYVKIAEERTAQAALFGRHA